MLGGRSVNHARSSARSAGRRRPGASFYSVSGARLRALWVRAGCCNGGWGAEVDVWAWAEIVREDVEN